MKMKTSNPKPTGFNKSNAKGKFHSNMSLHQETGKKSSK